MRYLFVIGALVLLTACAPRIDVGLNGRSPSGFGWNIGAADLLDPATASCRLGTYLDEIAARGYAKQIRIIYTPDWGPQILRDWIPVIRAKGFKVVVILSQDGRGGKYGDDSDLRRQQEWIERGLFPIRDILDAVQLANEPDGFSGKTPEEYAVWHQVMHLMVRRVAIEPPVPILGPDLRKGGTWWVAATELKYGRDYDIVNLHVTHMDEESELKNIHRAAIDENNLRPRTWITEGDWGQGPWYVAHGLPVERTYIYVYNGYEPESRRRGPDPVCP